MAPSEGFEPPCPFGQTVFKTAVISLSTSSACLVEDLRFELNQPEGNGFTVRPSSPTLAILSILAAHARCDLFTTANSI